MDNELLRTVQLAQLDVAKAFKKICEENNLRYMLDCGSLLGAVRHKGFIPWDDDMDFSMPREDYDRLAEIMQEKNGKGYTFVRWDTYKDYPHPYGKFTKDGTVYKEAKSDRSYGIFVDVFPCDTLPPEEEIKKVRFRLMSYRAMMRAKCGYVTYRQDGKLIPKLLLKNIPFMVLSLFFSRRYLIDAYDRLAQKYNGTGEERGCLQGNSVLCKWQCPASCYNNSTRVTFEDTDFAAPAQYDAYLRSHYGDYMQLPPEDQRGNQHQVVEIKL